MDYHASINVEIRSVLTSLHFIVQLIRKQLRPQDTCFVLGRAEESGVEAGVEVGWSRRFWLESASELESVKVDRLRLWPGAAG